MCSIPFPSFILITTVPFFLLLNISMPKKLCTHANNVSLCNAQKSRVLLFLHLPDFFFCNTNKFTVDSNT